MNKTIEELDDFTEFYKMNIGTERKKFLYEFNNKELLMILTLLEKSIGLITEGKYNKIAEKYSSDSFWDLFNLCYE